jgi:CRISPR-associated protein (TIGR03984 family)
MTPCNLLLYGLPPSSLADATAHFMNAIVDPAISTFALLTSPTCFLVGRIERVEGDPEIVTADHDNLTNVYEARVFNRTAELRWFRPPGEAMGKSVWLFDESPDPLARPSTGLTFEWEKTLGVQRLEQTYVLWGKSVNSKLAPCPVGWTTLAEYRLRQFAVPIAIKGKARRLQIIATEYLREDRYGNVIVCNERFVDLQPIANST